MTIEVSGVFVMVVPVLIILLTNHIYSSIQKAKEEAIETSLCHQYVDGVGVVNGHNGERYKIKSVERYRGAYKIWYVRLLLENKHGYKRWVHLDDIRIEKELYLKEVAE